MSETTQLPDVQVDVKEVANYISNPLGLIKKIAEKVGASVVNTGTNDKPVFDVTIENQVVSHDYCRTVADILSKCKKPAIEESKRQAQSAKEVITADVSFRKNFELAIDALSTKIRLPLTDSENIRNAEIAKIENAVIFDGFKPTSEQIKTRIIYVASFEVKRDFYLDFFAKATKAKAKSESILDEMLVRTEAEEQQAAEQVELLAKAERAQWVNQIAVIGYNLTGLPEHQLMARIDQLNSFSIDVDVYVEQFDNGINARSTALNSVNAAIDALKEVEAKAKRDGELKRLKNIPVEAVGWTPEGILEKIGQLKGHNFKADYCKELYGEFIDTNQDVIALLENLRAEKIAAAQKAIDDARVEADAKAEQARQDAEKAIAKAAQDAKEKAEFDAKAKADKLQADIDAKAKADAERAADEQYIKSIKNDSYQAFRNNGVDKDAALLVINLIADGKIPNVKIIF